MIKKLEDYFIGTNIIEYYQNLKKENPENYKKLTREQNVYLIGGKIIPNIMDISGIVLSFFNPINASLICAGEAVRISLYGDFLFKKMEHEQEKTAKIISKFDNKTIDKLVTKLKESG